MFEAHYRIEEGYYDGRALRSMWRKTRVTIPLQATKLESAWAEEPEVRNQLYRASTYPVPIVVLEKILEV